MTIAGNGKVDETAGAAQAQGNGREAFRYIKLKLGQNTMIQK
jgi:hypothetical protein